MTRNWEVSGSYVILENLEFAKSPPDDDGLVLLAPLNNAALRFSDVRGNLAGGGSRSRATPRPPRRTSSSTATRSTTTETSRPPSTRTSTGSRSTPTSATCGWWTTRCTATAATASRSTPAARVRVLPAPRLRGRNVAHHNKQNGFWSKQSTDVIFSQNTSYGHRPGNSSSGAGMGFQYAPERIWFLYNNIFDCELGIYVANDNGLGNGQNSYYIGNLITNIHSSGGFQSGSAYQNAGFVLAGSRNRYLVNNTLYQTDSGIAAPGSAGGLFMSNNIISNLTQAQGSHVFIEQPATASGSTIRNTLFQGTVRIKWGGNSPVYTLASFQSSHPGAVGVAAPASPSSRTPARATCLCCPVHPRWTPASPTRLHDVPVAVRDQHRPRLRGHAAAPGRRLGHGSLRARDPTRRHGQRRERHREKVRHQLPRLRRLALQPEPGAGLRELRHLARNGHGRGRLHRRVRHAHRAGRVRFGRGAGDAAARPGGRGQRDVHAHALEPRQRPGCTRPARAS